MFKRSCLIGCAILVSGLLFLGSSGCGNKEITASYARNNLSPELQSMAESKEQRKNRHARTFDTNLRQIPNDWDAIWLLERPVRLSVYPIP